MISTDPNTPFFLLAIRVPHQLRVSPEGANYYCAPLSKLRGCSTCGVMDYSYGWLDEKVIGLVNYKYM